MDATLGISVATLRPIAELLRQLGEDPAAFLDALGVTAALPPNTYIDAALVDRTLAVIAERRGDPAFALTLARTSSSRPLGLFGHMVWTSGTLRDALERAVQRYALVTQRTRLALIESPADGAGSDAAPVTLIRATPVHPTAPRGRVLTEFPFASFAIRAREATGDAARFRAVRFAHAGATSAAYDEVFRAPVQFGAAFDELEVDTASLALPLASADAFTAEALEARVAALTDEPARDPLVERVRVAAQAHLAAEPSPEVLARELGISERTLRRHLEQRGETVRSIVDTLRRERADALLAAGSSVKEVAFALGFSEASAFSRAYKRWTGHAPKAR